jgi:serine/threonine protein kinase
MPADPRRVKELFVAATDLRPADRPAFLDRECGGDPDLRQRVQQLLHAHDQPASALDRPFDLDRTNPRPPSAGESTAAVGDRIGPYKLLERIGEGGMGEVWVADQLEPIRRRVALKLIKPGMDSRSVLGRFEAERQALAVMDHPNIARVYEAGTTADGRPFFVMELVKGTPITEFADARKLTPEQRLELFVPVCQAVQHAHLKGIIHRDIKPSNVLVELHDDRMVPKVIDFGVAKAVGQQLTERTIYTGFGALVGTPAYMAPEQATFNALDVDTRADVYALGVLLYELLAGSPPIEKERLKKAALDEVLRMVREEEPPRPSQRLSTADTRASIAAVRGTEPAKLSAQMKGELDWIVMKALEKDRTRRYETANGFAADVQRYLTGEPVQAVPPSLGYRVRKFYRRNRAAVLFGLTVAVMLVTGVAVATVLAIQARRAEALAEAKRIEAEEQRQEAEQNKNAWLELSEVYFDAAIDAEIRSNSARIDADLLEYKSDSRVGLLRLARPLNDTITIPSIGPNFSGTTFISIGAAAQASLRQFQAAAVITAGQEFVPLVPPLHISAKADQVAGFDFPSEDLRYERSPDRALYAIHSYRVGVSLWSVPKFDRVGLLREKDERILHFGFTPDGKTVYTQDTDGVVRFWNTDGSLRAKTPVRPERFVYPAGMTHRQLINSTAYDDPNRLTVADGVAILQSRQVEWEWEKDDAGKLSRMSPKHGTVPRVGPVEVYSTRTGQFIRQFDLPEEQKRWGYWQTSPDGRWLVWSDVLANQALIISAADGRELARLDHPGPEPFLSVAISPTGKWVMSHRHNGGGPPSVPNVRLWQSHDWQQVQDAALTDAITPVKRFSNIVFIADDLLSLWSSGGDNAIFEGLIRIGKSGSWTSSTALASHGSSWDSLVVNLVAELGGTLLRNGSVLLDANTLQRLKPPPGRKYAAEFAQLAADGRFWGSLDTVTERVLPSSALFQERNYVEDGLGVLFSPADCEGRYFPEYGHVGVTRTNESFELRILPDPTKLTVPPAMLELWAQLVVGGELTPEGTFQPWDQPTWVAKQRELAAMNPPNADIPFPGWVAHEPNLCHFVRATVTQNAAERNKLLDEWWRLTGRKRPKPEPDTWRTKETLPPPRADK